MKLGTKARYAVMALVEMAKSKGEPVSLSLLAQRQELPVSYLEQLFLKLRRHEIVTSYRGSSGGYVLAKKPCDISIWDIVVAVDKPFKATRCESKALGCQKDGKQCDTHHLWEKLEETMADSLKTTYLQDVI
jgi:Rrf2 family iron-sulfur cluster assembly transcriptional regulator